MFIFLRLFRLLRTGEHPVRRLFLTILGVVLLNVVFGVGFYFAEQETQPGLTLADSIWWAMVTMTTVGYGDYYPQTFAGRFFIAYPCFLFGISLIGVLLGTISNLVITFFLRRRTGKLRLHMKNHLIIAGYPEQARIERLVHELQISSKFSKCEQVLVTRNLEELPDALCKKQLHFVHGKFLEDEVLERAAVQHARAVLLLPEDHSAPDDHALFATAASLAIRFPHLKESIISLISYGQSVGRFQEAGLRYVWGNELPDHLLAQDLNQPGIGSVYHELLSYGTGCELYLRPVPNVGQEFRELQLATLELPQPVQLLGLKSHGRFRLNPDPTEKTEAGDHVVLLANNAEVADQVHQLKH